MPRVMVEILEGRTLDQKRALVKTICEEVAKGFSVPESAVAVRISEVRFIDLGSDSKLYWDASMQAKKAIYGGAAEPRITIQCVEGRSVEAKRIVVKQVAEQCAKILGLSLADVKIFVNEMKRDQFSVAGKLICD